MTLNAGLMMSATPTPTTPAEPLSRQEDGRCYACGSVAWRVLASDTTPGGGEECAVCHPSQTRASIGTCVGCGRNVCGRCSESGTMIGGGVAPLCHECLGYTTGDVAIGDTEGAEG